MKPPVLLLAAALTAPSAPALAQSTSELVGKLQACSQLEGAVLPHDLHRLDHPAGLVDLEAQLARPLR